MLTIRNLSLYLVKDLRMLLEDFCFNLQPTDKVALIGEEGNGKSSLLKAIYDLEEAGSYMEISGEIYKKNEVVGYLPQILHDEVLELTPREYFEKVQQHLVIDFDYGYFYLLMDEMGIQDDLIHSNIKIRELSGGEKIKFFLLMELMKKPTVLLLDEPSNDLDLNMVKWLEHFILNLSIPVMFVSHDEALLEACANVIVHIEQLKRKSEPKPRYTIARMKYEDYISNMVSKIEKQSMVAKKEKEIFERKMQRYQKICQKVDHQLKITKNDHESKNLKDKMHSIKSMGKRFEKEKEKLTKRPEYELPIIVRFQEDVGVPPGKRVVDFERDELRVSGKLLSKNVRLQLFGADKVCIIGENGAGKSTLLKEVIGHLQERGTLYGYMPQDYSEHFDMKKNAVEILSKKFDKEERTNIRTYLGSMNFTKEEMFRPISELSGGQRAKLYFSKMILDGAKVLILDEPTRNLSPLSNPEVRKALKEYKGVILAVSHDRRFIFEVFDKVLLLTKEGLEEVRKEEFEILFQ